MSNHFHLLVHPRNVTLAAFMRRLLTSYAVTFNLRHNRSGHLFQNRYKSIVCDENEYLLELVRYIHLNPIRAGLVADVDHLDRFPWSGHSVVMGKIRMQGQDVDSVLSLFGKRVGEARRRYRVFVQDGAAQGRRDDLVGQPIVGPKRDPARAADTRILGNSDFVETLRQHEYLGQRIKVRFPLPDIVEAVAERFDIPGRALSSTSRSPVVLKARAVVCHLALTAGHSAAGIGRHPGMSRYGVCVAGTRGKKLVEENGEFASMIGDIEKSAC